MSSLPIEEEIVFLEDGFVYYDPKPNRGVLSANNLRKIADELDKRNAQWQKSIEDYFSATYD